MLRRLKIPLLAIMLGLAYGLGRHEMPPLRIQYLHLDPAPQMDGLPATVLNFGLSNESTDDVSSIVVRVSIQKTSEAGEHERVGGPYTLVGKKSVVVHPGQTLGFELELEESLRRLYLPCRCERAFG